MAADKNTVCKITTAARAAFSSPQGAWRTRHLATPILGTLDSRRRRLCASRRILLFQPDQARSRAPRARLATFIVSSRRSQRPIPARLGGRGRVEWRVRRTRPVAVGRISRRRNPPSFGGKKDGGLRCANPPYGLARLMMHAFVA